MKHTFIVAIDDGDCRYEYPLTIQNGDNIAIHDIYKTLCKAYDVEPSSEGIYLPSKARAVKELLDIKDA